MSDAPPTVEDGDDELLVALGMDDRPPPLTLASGQILAESYRIERTLGAGGMGVVYLARDLRLRREVAIKVHTAMAGEPGAQRLVREARSLAQLVHPNVVTVHEVGAWTGHPYVAMEYVPGGTARTWLEAAPRSTREILTLYLAAARGLAAAHAAGLVHRDFKPDNVLVGDDGRIRVADFGIAREVGDCTLVSGGDLGDRAATVTATGAVMGTPAYMAPEQSAGAPVGPAADQYAFAVAVWEAIAGERPTEETQVAPPAMPREVALALRRARDPDPDARFPSMDALIAALQAALAKPAARRRTLVVVGLAGAALASATVLTWALATRGHRAAAADPCAAADDRLGETWNPARKDAIRSAYAATGSPDAAVTFDRVAAVLDDHAAAWTAQRVDACEATQVRGEQSAQLLDLRDHCLDRRLAELDALADVLEHADAALVARGLAATDVLGDLSQCEDVPHLTAAAPLPDDPAARAAIVRAGEQTARAHALFDAGRLAEALTTATEAVAQADATGYAPASAEARLWLGLSQLGKADRAGARTTLEHAAQDAAAARDDRIAVGIWLAMLKLVLGAEGDLREAERLLPFAQAALVRAGTPPELDADLATVIGTLRRLQGRWSEAQASLERAIAIGESVRGPDDPRLASPLDALATTLMAQGDAAGAHAAYTRGIGLIQAAYGSESSHLTVLLNNRATVLTRTGKLDEALREFERVLAVKERALGPTHPDLSSTLANLAGTAMQMDRADEALVYARRAVAVAEAHHGAEHPAFARMLVLRADALGMTGDLAAARIDLDRALAINEKALAADHPEIADVLLVRAYLRFDMDDAAGARADADRARAIVGAQANADPALQQQLEAVLAIIDRK